MGPERKGAIARGALVLGALVVAVWLALGLHPARLENQGRAVQRGKLDDRTFHQAVDLFRRAQDGTPDTDPALLEGGLLSAGGRPRAGARVLEGVVADEPENSKAWALLFTATRQFDRRRAARARARVLELRPPLPR
jgi:hypothetical protein